MDAFPQELRSSWETVLADHRDDPEVLGILMGYAMPGSRELVIEVIRKPSQRTFFSLFQENIRLLRGRKKQDGFSIVETAADIKQNAAQPGFPSQTTQRKLPLTPGISISVNNDECGTLGCFAVEKATGRVVFVTNDHVFRNGGFNNAPVFYPAAFDRPPVSRNEIGRQAGPSLRDADGDATYAYLDTRYLQAGDYELSAPQWPARMSHIRRFVPGEAVYKYGRTTLYTTGTAERVGQIRLPGNSNILMNCFEVHAPTGSMSSICDEGDSGSVWLAASDHALVGLHCAGYSTGNIYTRAYACHADVVFDRLGLKLP